MKRRLLNCIAGAVIGAVCGVVGVQVWGVPKKEGDLLARLDFANDTTPLVLVVGMASGAIAGLLADGRRVRPDA